MNASTELRNLNAVTLHKRNSLEAKCNVRKADELATPRFVLLGWDSSGSYRDRWRALENTVRRLKKITSVDCYLSLIMAEIIIKLRAQEWKSLSGFCHVLSAWQKGGTPK
ncbi:uncharacterized protein LOC110827061 isoform X3 [Zootermopsis nevadensis]|uniref:uncharacterized protein LOC110827061 isoform X3 n=1 Tax=Zootermopsis nevadensis TaxID=136037 RepID=UPI000B8E66D6|nr:uncharacterized protein LOC110827061 isoform X3 [Zootermopsis nevadensis]